MIEAIRKIDTGRIKAFFMGPIYPAIIACAVLIGSLTGLEIYFNLFNLIGATAALLICDSIRPIIINLCATHLQVSLINSPFYPGYSDYLFSGWRLWYIVACAVIIFAAIVFFVIKNKVYKKISFKSTPLLIPLLAVCASFLLGGIGTQGWTLSGLPFTLANIATHILIFTLFYHGFSDDEDTMELGRYAAYVAMLLALIISAELLHLYLTSDNILVDGVIIKENVALGWGIWNLVGASLTVLIPVIFYGTFTSKHPWIYFAVATLTWIMAVLTMSRNALVFATLFYVASVIICCFVGKNKVVFRIITAAGILLFAILAIVFWDKIYALLSDYFERGFSDNGRYALWEQAFEIFLKRPILGSGFYAFNVETAVFGPLPKMAHNLVLQLLMTSGVIGLFSYGWYLFDAARLVFKKPNIMKTMLSLSLLALLCGSMLDNFVFNVYPMYLFGVLLAIIAKNAKK